MNHLELSSLSEEVLKDLYLLTEANYLGVIDSIEYATVTERERRLLIGLQKQLKKELWEVTQELNNRNIFVDVGNIMKPNVPRKITPTP